MVKALALKGCVQADGIGKNLYDTDTALLNFSAFDALPSVLQEKALLANRLPTGRGVTCFQPDPGNSGRANKCVRRAATREAAKHSEKMLVKLAELASNKHLLN